MSTMNEQDQKHMPENKKTSITEEKIDAVIISEEFASIGKKTTVCCLTLVNGFEIIGVSACVDPKNFDLEKGKYWARKEAVDQIWKLEGYLLASKLSEKETEE